MSRCRPSGDYEIGEGSRPVQRILVATDGSEGAARAVDAAATLATKLDAELWIVNVTDNLSTHLLERIARHERITIGDAFTEFANRILAQARERAEKLGAKRVRLKSRSGDSTEGILETAREMSADAIFVGRRGVGRLQGLLLGSVSQKLAGLAPCMVMIVP